MISRLLILLTGVLLGILLTYTAFNYHLVVTKQRYLLIPRTQRQLKDFYVDVRNWRAQEWMQRPALTNAMLRAGYTNFIQETQLPPNPHFPIPFPPLVPRQ